jgi:predicted component of type VI protein secretion system
VGVRTSGRKMAERSATRSTYRSNAVTPRSAFRAALRPGFAVSLVLAIGLGQAWAQPQPAATQPASPVVPAAPAAQPQPPHRWTAQQIREAFDLADTDNNGELTRAEIQRAGNMPRSFEEADRNKDGVLTRDEYEGAFVR